MLNSACPIHCIGPHFTLLTITLESQLIEVMIKGRCINHPNVSLGNSIPAWKVNKESHKYFHHHL